MNVTRQGAIAAALFLPWLAFAGPARATHDGGKSPCADDLQRVGDLGIIALDCDCTYISRTSSLDGQKRIRRWAFRSEPQVGEIRAGGPAEGKLREGDMITAIDGVLITTRAGSRMFADVTPGKQVSLTVRREGREFPVRIVADAVCPEEALAGVMLVAPVAPVPPVSPETPMTPEAPRAYGTPRESEAPEAVRRAQAERMPLPAIPTEEALPRGWSGFGLSCRNCGGEPGEDGAPPVWRFGTVPTIYFIDPESPAARAGIQIGDVLTHLDGISLLDEEGGRRFGALQPGQNVKWTIRRGGRVVTATVIPELRPGARPMRARDRLRYAGGVGGAEVEVRGADNVVVDDDGDEIVITTRDATIRIKKAAAAAPKASNEKKK
jgi:hypothetical protein